LWIATQGFYQHGSHQLWYNRAAIGKPGFCPDGLTSKHPGTDTYVAFGTVIPKSPKGLEDNEGIAKEN
jgi:hypothetical protein